MAQSRKPKTIAFDAWWYEERGGILICKQIRNKAGEYIRTDLMRIPWYKLELALARKKKQNNP